MCTKVILVICSKHGWSSVQGWVESGKKIAVFNFKLTVTLKYVANEFAAFLGTNEQVKVTFAFIILYLVSTLQKFSLSLTWLQVLV